MSVDFSWVATHLKLTSEIIGVKDHLNLCHKGTLLKGPEPQHAIMKLVYWLTCSTKARTNGNIAKCSSSSITYESTATIYMKRNICRNNVLLRIILLLTHINKLYLGVCI